MNILVTGANGFIASNIIKLLSDNTNFNFYRGTRSTIDLYCKNNIEKYLDDNKIDTIIHCAIEGGEIDTRHKSTTRNAVGSKNRSSASGGVTSKDTIMRTTSVRLPLMTEGMYLSN